MLGQEFDTSHDFLQKYHFGVFERAEGSVTLVPEGYFAKDLITLTLDLEEKIVYRARMKLSRDLMTHEILGKEVQGATRDFIESAFPPECGKEIESWMTGETPTWQTSSDKIELKRYTLTSRISQSWLQLEALAKRSRESSWWSRITGR